MYFGDGMQELPNSVWKGIFVSADARLESIKHQDTVKEVIHFPPSPPPHVFDLFFGLFRLKSLSFCTYEVVVLFELDYTDVRPRRNYGHPFIVYRT